MVSSDPTTERQIDAECALKPLQRNSPLSHKIKNFEPREQQKQMLLNILEAYNNDKIALIEAGTGTGKSIAYLIPALLWAARCGEKTVISTNTIPLQEQLIGKDIPLLLDALGIHLKAVLVKGMNNYLCLRKLEETQNEIHLLPSQEAKEIQEIAQWKQQAKEGSRSELPLVPSAQTWERLKAERDTCNHVECPHYHQCFFFKARRETHDAHLLIVNHHLFFADLAQRSESDSHQQIGILPSYKRIVLDEAHHVEAVATNFFASRVSKMSFFHILTRLWAESQHKAHGKIPLLKEKLSQRYGKSPPDDVVSILNRLTIDLPAERREVVHHVGEAFEAVEGFLQNRMFYMRQNPEEGGSLSERKIRFLEEHQRSPYWQKSVIPAIHLLSDSIKRYVQSLLSLEMDVGRLKNEKLKEEVSSLLHDIKGLANRLENSCAAFQLFAFQEENDSKVRWMDIPSSKGHDNPHLVTAELDISSFLATHLFQQFPTIALCSATLATNQDFQFIRNRLGLTEDLIKNRFLTEKIYDSPFDFWKQALLMVPTDLPHPSEPQFIQQAAESIWQAVTASRGNALVLFTSYTALQTCHHLLAQRLTDHRYCVLKQGESQRRTLLSKFKATNGSVLFATASFWEGIDVVGEALRCVIIVKLPFQVPNDPLTEARAEAVTAQGRNAFIEYLVPNAIVKFKQGFGRLIRNKQDRGCIVCLDSRLFTKQYGKFFLNSLPYCQTAFNKSANIHRIMSEFYRKTHYLTFPRGYGA